MPLIASDFCLASCQSTLFTPEAEVSTARLLSGLLAQWIENRFNAEPTILPVPDNAPKEIPKILLQSRSGEWKCEIASGRINLFWKLASLGVESTPMSVLFQEMVPLLQAYAQFVNARVARMAAVIIRFAQHATPGRFLAEHFCKEQLLRAPFDRPESFELHGHKRFSLSGRVMVNSWVRNKTGTFSENENDQPIVLVEQDLNTLSEDIPTRAFSSDDIDWFFQTVVPSFEETLALYYSSERLS